MKQLAIVALSLLIGAAIDAAINAHQWQAGYAQATAEETARKDEHDRVMRYIGVCKWSKIVADDIRCKSELP